MQSEFLPYFSLSLLTAIKPVLSYFTFQQRDELVTLLFNFKNMYYTGYFSKHFIQNSQV
jgi:hypothetical protein